MIGKTISHYSVLEKLGEGGMGVVYKAQDTLLERFVALKFLPDEYADDPGLRERFLREARAASALNHPNICTIYEGGEEDGRTFIAMEFLDGVTLKELVRRGPLRYDQLLGIGIDVISGLAEAHSEGIIHRDIKLANIFLSKSGRAKILDFGLAKKTGPRRMAMTTAAVGPSDAISDESQLTSGLAALGTAAYMSPEQALGKPLDERTDLFSFGIVLYEMATGQAPFQGDTTGMMFLSIVQEAPPAPRALNPDVPEELQGIISRCLEKDRNARYQHASDIEEALQRLRQKSGRSSAASLAAHDREDGRTAEDVKEGGTSWPPGQLRAASEPTTDAKKGTPGRRFLKPMAAAATVILMLLAAGVIYLHTRNAHALGTHANIIVADFTNTTGDPIFDSTLRQALAIDLEQSPYLNVVGNRRIASALRQMEKPADTRLSHEVAREVCLRTNSQAFLAGSIAQLANGYQLKLEVLDCSGDEVIASSQGEAVNREAVIDALGQAGRRLRRELGESLPSLLRFNKPLVEATTSSLEALQAYTTGERLRQQKGNVAALPYLKRAVEIDPNLALGYLSLGATYANIAEPELAKENCQKAFELRNRVSEWERFHIETAYYTIFGDINKAVQMCTEWIRTYPKDPYPHIWLAARYADLGRYDQSAEQLREAIRLAPDNYVPYVNLTFAYLALKRPDEARATLEAARAQHFSTESLLVARYALAFVNGDTATMQQIVESAKGKPGYEDILLNHAADTEAFDGRLGKSRSLRQEAEAAAIAVGAQERAAKYYASQAWVEAEFGNEALARKLATQALTMSHGRDVVENSAFALARAGDMSQATQLAEELNRQYPQYSLVQGYSLPSIRALIETERGRPANVVKILKPVLQYELSLGSTADLRPAYVRGLAYLQLGRGADAAREFGKVIDNPGIVLNAITGSLSYLQLARAEAMAGELDAARTHYQDFLALWKDADPDISILRQAKTEYDKLQ